MYFLQNKVLENFRLYKNHQRSKEVKTYLDYSMLSVSLKTYVVFQQRGKDIYFLDHFNFHLILHFVMANVCNSAITP